MRFCPSCDRHVFEGTITCPFCQAPCGIVRGGSLATLGITLGVALTACGEPKPGDVNTTSSAEFTSSVDDADDTFDAWGATYTVSGDSPWNETWTTSTTTGTATETGADTDTTDNTTGTDTGADTGAGTDTGTSTTTGTDTGTGTTTGTETGTSTTTTTGAGSTGTASSTG